MWGSVGESNVACQKTSPFCSWEPYFFSFLGPNTWPPSLSCREHTCLLIFSPKSTWRFPPTQREWVPCTLGCVGLKVKQWGTGTRTNKHQLYSHGRQHVFRCNANCSALQGKGHQTDLLLLKQGPPEMDCVIFKLWTYSQHVLSHTSSKAKSSWVVPQMEDIWTSKFLKNKPALFGFFNNGQ